MAHRQSRIICQHRSNSGQNRRTARTPALHIRARRFAGNPFRLSVRQRRSAVKTHCQLDSNPWPFALDAAEESAIEFPRRAAHQASLDSDTGVEQSAQAFAGNPRIRIIGGCHDARDTSGDQRVGAGRRPAKVSAWLERHIGGRSARALTGFAQRENLGVWFARAPMPAFADDRFGVRNHAADAWIRLRAEQPALGQAQCASHVSMVRRGELRGGG